MQLLATPVLAMSLLLASSVDAKDPAKTAEPASADLDAVALVLEEIACTASPEPAPALQALMEARRLDLDSALRMDSTTCWALTPPIEAGDIAFSHVCAAAEDPALIEQHPDLFWRGPGTSPGTELTLVTPADEETLQAWGMANITEVSPAYNIAPSYRIDDATELSCNSLAFTF